MRDGPAACNPFLFLCLSSDRAAMRMYVRSLDEGLPTDMVAWGFF